MAHIPEFRTASELLEEQNPVGPDGLDQDGNYLDSVNVEPDFLVVRASYTLPMRSTWDTRKSNLRSKKGFSVFKDIDAESIANTRDLVDLLREKLANELGQNRLDSYSIKAGNRPELVAPEGHLDRDLNTFVPKYD